MALQPRLRSQSRHVGIELSIPVIFVLFTIIYSSVTFTKNLPPSNYDYSCWQTLLNWMPGGLVAKIANYLLLCLTAFLLLLFNNAYSLIRVRTTLHLFFYFLMIASFPYFYSLQVGNLIAPLFSIALYFLFGSYQKQEPVIYVFYGMLFIGLGSLLFSQLLFFILPFYIAVYSFKALTARTFFSGLVGATVPYWFYFGHAFFYGKMDSFYASFLSLKNFDPIDYSAISISYWVFIGFVLFLLLISVISYFINSYQDKIRTRIYMNVLVFIGLLIVVLIFLQPQFVGISFQLLLPISAILAAHLFKLTNNKASRFLLSIMVCLFIIVGVYNVWML